MPCPWFQRQESPDNPPGKSLLNKTPIYVLRACTKYMYLNVIAWKPGGDHPEAERPVLIPNLLLLLLLRQKLVLRIQVQFLLNTLTFNNIFNFSENFHVSIKFCIQIMYFYTGKLFQCNWILNFPLVVWYKTANFILFKFVWRHCSRSLHWRCSALWPLVQLEMAVALLQWLFRPSAGTHTNTVFTTMFSLQWNQLQDSTRQINPNGFQSLCYSMYDYGFVAINIFIIFAGSHHAWSQHRHQNSQVG